MAKDNADPAKMMWKSARYRAKRRGIVFDIQPSDITIPSHCPVLGVELKRKVNRGPCDASPSLDRTDPSKGYVAGNIVVVSLRANRIKNDATLEELERVACWLRAITKPELAQE